MKNTIIALVTLILLLSTFFWDIEAMSENATCPPNYETVPALYGYGPIYDQNDNYIGHFPTLICGTDDPTPNMYCCIKMKVQ